jgi:hypothetical protein
VFCKNKNFFGNEAITPDGGKNKSFADKLFVPLSTQLFVFVKTSDIISLEEKNKREISLDYIGFGEPEKLFPSGISFEGIPLYNLVSARNGELFDELQSQCGSEEECHKNSTMVFIINFYLPTAKLRILSSDDDAVGLGENKVIIQGFKIVDDLLPCDKSYVLYSTHLLDKNLNSNQVLGEIELLKQFLDRMMTMFDNPMNTICTKDTSYRIEATEKQGVNVSFIDSQLLITCGT